MARDRAANRFDSSGMDAIVCLGDVARSAAFDDGDLVEELRACPGRRILVLGNHDLVLRRELEEAGLRDQCAAGLCCTAPPTALAHMPLARVPYGCVYVCAHLHARGHRSPRRLAVGGDAMGFAPRRFDWLLEDLA